MTSRRLKQFTPPWSDYAVLRERSYWMQLQSMGVHSWHGTNAYMGSGGVSCTLHIHPQSSSFFVLTSVNTCLLCLHSNFTHSSLHVLL
mgnify:CR=1 FL=1